MTKDEALKLALEAFEEIAWSNSTDWQRDRAKVVIPAIKEALAQPERDYERGFIDGMQKQMQSSVDKAVNAMTKPTYYIPSKDQRTWVGLTDWEINSVANNNNPLDGIRTFARAIEAKLKEKNT